MIKDLLKHTIACRIAGCLAAFCLAFVSCTSAVDDGLQDSRVITFRTPQANTRAVVENGETLPADFQVWGWHGTDGANTDNIFDATIVSKDAGWNYTDGVRYWKAGETYNFYAVYPVFPQPTGAGDTQTTSTVTADGVITVQNFDCFKTGTEAVDLMTATAKGDGSNPAPVALKFKHELSKVTVIVRAEQSVSATINKAALYGMDIQGTLAKGSWTLVENTDTQFELAKEMTVDSQTPQADLFGTLLLIPQDCQGLKLDISITRAGEQQETQTISLGTSIAQWAAAQSYRYVLTIKADAITFGDFTVDEWGVTNTGGNINIGNP